MWRRLSLAWRTFTPVEEAVLAAVASALPAPSAEQLRAQIRQVSRVQRVLDWTEICFYAMRRGRVHWPEAVIFPNRGEFELAVVVYRVDGQRFQTRLGAVAAPAANGWSVLAPAEAYLNRSLCRQTRLQGRFISAGADGAELTQMRRGSARNVTAFRLTRVR